MPATSKVLALAAALALTAALAFGPSSGAAPVSAAKNARVSVKDDFFSPRTARITRGGRVTWVWRGDSAHNVRFRKVPRGAKRPRGSSIRTSGQITRTFRKRGTYRYVCTLHVDLGMKGSVRVE